ncbi:MAG: ABC transporter transmembrane domain-containing protein, partial [Pseudomonadota bacterium]
MSGRGLDKNRGSDAVLEADRKRRDLRPLKTLLPYVLRHKGVLIAAFLALVTASAATLAVPMAVRRIIDFGFTDAGGGFIDRYFGFMILVVLILALASSARYYFVTWLGERIVCELRTAVFAHLTRLSPGFYDKSQSGEVVSRLTADTTQIKSAIGASSSIALRNLFLFLGATALMIITSPRLSMIVLAAIPLIVLPMVAFGRSVRRRSRLAQDTLAEAASYSGEILGAIRTVQAFTFERRATAAFGGAVERAFQAARASTAARAALTAFALFLIFSSVVAVLWIGAQDVLAGRTTPGELGQFVLYAVFAAGALGELSQVWGEVAQAAGAAERLSELLEEEPAIRSPENPVAMPIPTRGAITFDGVGFAYPSRPDVTVFNDLSFQIEPGETVALVGPSGAGKSSILSLILRAYDPLTGSVRIDGVDAASAHVEALRQSMSLVPQESVIFAASARDNIGFGNPDADGTAIENAARMANAHDFVVALPEGYDTMLGERGVLLSGGQRQRISIARAILRDAPILLLDEATSALDAQSEALVQGALETLMEGRTTIVVAHRLATVMRADRILVIDDGRILDQGTHQALVSRGGLYADLARLQFTGNALEPPVRRAG